MEETNKATHLLGALSDGHTIECAKGTFAGLAVSHEPRSEADPESWELVGGGGIRYTHAECRVRCVKP